MSATRTLTDFIRALRSVEVAVSPAEAIDAAGALALVGYGDKAAMKAALRPVLAKSVNEDGAFDRLFDLYFSRRKSEAREAAGEQDGDEDGEGEAPEDFFELSQSGDEAAIEAALERAGRAAGVQDIRFSTQTAYYAQKMLKEMGVEEMEARLLERLQARTTEAEAEANAMIEARRELMARARGHVEQQFAVFGAGATQQFREDYLAKKPINALDRSDFQRMRPLIEKIAKRLAAKHSRRRRQRNVGQLDVRRTLRANAGLGGVPFELFWKQKKRDKAKIVCLCDVSGSVARYVRFLLLLLHSLDEVVPEIRSFAFSGQLGEVTDDLDADHFESVMEHIVRRYGMQSTDYGASLSDFTVKYRGAVDRRTSLIILGDGRSNHGDPRVDLFRDLASRAKRTIWLSPEPQSLWGSGDSELPRYRPHCNAMAHVATLADLERVIDRVLASYA